MKILAFSDLHSEEGALQKLAELQSFWDFDHVLITGDLTNKAVSFVEDVCKKFPKSFTIPGNMDPPAALKILEDTGTSLHGKRKEVEDGLNMVGFGYSCQTPFCTPGEISEKEMLSKLEKLDIDENTILVTHTPPLGVLDEVGEGVHAGSKALRKVIEDKKPFINFCGHIHETVGHKMLGKTHVIKIPAAKDYKCCMVDVINKKIEVQFLNL